MSRKKKRREGRPEASGREPAPAAASPRRISRRAWIVIAANAALLLAGLAVLVQRDCRRTGDVALAFASDYPPVPVRECLEQLGGAEPALRHLRLYLAMPRWIAPHRAEAVGLLGSCGPGARGRLLAALAEPDGRVRAAAASALGLLGQDAASAQGELLKLLADEDPEVRAAAASSLGLAGPPFGPAVEPLAGLLGSDREWKVRARAAESLDRIGPIEPGSAAAVKSLARGLGDREGLVREAAAKALGRYGPAARAAVPELVEALAPGRGDRSEHLDAIARMSAAEALGRIGPGAAEAVPALVRLLADPKASIRLSAAEALGRIGPAAAGARTALERAGKDESEDVRQAASAALARLRGRY